jgi:hypothetical protein
VVGPEEAFGLLEEPAGLGWIRIEEELKTDGVNSLDGVELVRAEQGLIGFVYEWHGGFAIAGAIVVLGGLQSEVGGIAFGECGTR